MTWRPQRRYDYVRTELAYVPPHRRRDLVERLLRDVVAPGGRLIVCDYGSGRLPEVETPRSARLLREWGYPIGGEAEGVYPDGRVACRVVWIGASAT